MNTRKRCELDGNHASVLIFDNAITLYAEYNLAYCGAERCILKTRLSTWFPTSEVPDGEWNSGRGCRSAEAIAGDVSRHGTLLELNICITGRLSHAHRMIFQLIVSHFTQCSSVPALYRASYKCGWKNRRLCTYILSVAFTNGSSQLVLSTEIASFVVLRDWSTTMCRSNRSNSLRKWAVRKKSNQWVLCSL